MSGETRAAGPLGDQLSEQVAEGRLSDLTPGTHALVVRLSTPGQDPTDRRLASLGFTPGTQVEVLRRAPMGDPAVYRLKDYEVCLRRSEAGRVVVTWPVEQ